MYNFTFYYLFFIFYYYYFLLFFTAFQTDIKAVTVLFKTKSYLADITQLYLVDETCILKYQTCQPTPIKSVTHAFDITHTLTHIHNSFTRIPPNLAARLKKSIMFVNLLTDMLRHVTDLPPVTSQ